MLYKLLVDVYQKIENTPKRLDKTYFLSELLRSSETKDLDKIILLIQGRIYPPWDERKIGVASRLVLKAIHMATGVSSSKVELEWKNLGDLGDVAEKLVGKKKQVTLFSQNLTVNKVFSNLQKLSTLSGIGAIERKLQLIIELLTSAKPTEAKYIVRTVLEDLRVGIGEGSLRDAIVWSSFPPVEGILYQCLKCKSYVPLTKNCLNCNENLDLKKIKAAEEKKAREKYNKLVSIVQNAYNLTNDFSIVAKSAREGSLENISLEPGNPIKVMLAQKVNSMKEGFTRVSVPCQIEYKYDGFRMQVHKSGNNIVLYTRRLEDVTEQFPEVVSYIKDNIKAKSFIIDGEAVGFSSKTGKYLPFQSISQRIRRKYDIQEIASKFPVELNMFDIIYHDGNTLIKEPFSKRRAVLVGIVNQEPKKGILAKALVTDNEKEAIEFYDESLKLGNEGIMIKNLEAPYKPGSRVGYMVKLKPVMESLDLVIVGAEWGEGKRSSWLTSFTLACVDENNNYLGIGKVGTGIKELEGAGLTFNELTEALKPLIVSEKAKEIVVKPKIVVEINYEEIQKSPTYSSGYALRFPRVVKLREDRLALDCSTLDQVEELYDFQRGR